MYWLSVKSMLGQNCQMFDSMRAKKTAGIKLPYFCQYGDKKKKKKKNPTTKEQSWAYILDTIESESTTRFKNRSLDHMMTSDWLVDVSDDRCTTNWYIVENGIKHSSCLHTCICVITILISIFICRQQNFKRIHCFLL